MSLSRYMIVSMSRSIDLLLLYRLEYDISLQALLIWGFKQV
jgi:hypothetical protein